MTRGSINTPKTNSTAVIYGRDTLQGMWIPRRDLTDWRVTIRDSAYTRSSPGPVASVRVQLDSIGCLTNGSISLKKPGSIPRPFEQQVFVEIYSRVLGWIPVCRACLPPANPDGPQEWTLSLQPGEVRDMDGYFDGSLVGYFAEPAPDNDTRTEAQRQVDLKAAQYTETNRTVVERYLKANPSASIGVNWQGQVVLASPESGSAVMVSRANFYDWKMQPEVVLPYATESRWDGGKGWAKGEYRSMARPPCTPRKAVDAGSVTFKDGIYPAGPAVINQREIIINWWQEAKAGEPPPAPVRYTEQEMLLSPAHPTTRKVTAEQYAHVSVYDLQSWYEGSALAGQDDSKLAEQQQAVAAQQGAYTLLLSTLGAEHSLTAQAADKLADAQNTLRLLRAGSAVDSFYEPLTAKLSYGFVGQNLGPGVVTGIVMWMSTLPWDSVAAGWPLTAEDINPDPLNPLAMGIEGVEDYHVIHPFASPHTLMVAEAPLGELSQQSNGLPWQPSALTIPESYFRGPMGPSLAAAMDVKWKENREAEDLQREQDGTTPDVQMNEGQPFTHSFGAGTVLTGDLPAGLQFVNGVLTGTPTATGEMTVSIDGQPHTIWIRNGPPSRRWDGRWYLHVAAWWAVITPPVISQPY